MHACRPTAAQVLAMPFIQQRLRLFAENCYRLAAAAQAKQQEDQGQGQDQPSSASVSRPRSGSGSGASRAQAQRTKDAVDEAQKRYTQSPANSGTDSLSHPLIQALTRSGTYSFRH